jgi:hypothetical protein
MTCVVKPEVCNFEAPQIWYLVLVEAKILQCFEGRLLMPSVYTKLGGVTISSFPKIIILNEWEISPGCIAYVRALDLLFEPYELFLL